MRKLVAALAVSSLLYACGDNPGGGTGGGTGGSGGSGGTGTGGGSAGGAAGGSAGGTAGGAAGGSAGGAAGGSAGGAAGGSAGGAAGGGAGGSGMTWVGPDAGVSSRMGFFVTSRGMGLGGDLRGDAGDGLTGADRFCAQLAGTIDPALGAKTWRAYLSTSTVDAITRIGNGPWRNSKDVIIANSLAQLHDDAGVNLLSQTTNLDERGLQVPTAPLQHDILTGSTSSGRADNDHCNNWTANSSTFLGRVGHSNRMGGGQEPTSWNSAHDNSSCSQTGNPNITNGGGRGSIYCFEAN